MKKPASKPDVEKLVKIKVTIHLQIVEYNVFPPVGKTRIQQF